MLPNIEKKPPWAGWYKSKAWLLRRDEQLRVEPWCRFCAKAGKRTPATVADHVIPHRGNWTAFITGVLQSLCAHHHSSTKQSMEAGKRAGCDESGMPIDKTHPWSV